MKTLLRNIWELDPDKAQNNSTDYSISIRGGGGVAVVVVVIQTNKQTNRLQWNGRNLKHMVQ